MGVYWSSTLNDDHDIARQVRYTYCYANILKFRFTGAPGLSKTIYLDLIVLRFTQVSYGVSILGMRYIGFVLLTMIVNVFCIIFLNGPVLVYLKLNAIINTFDAIFRKTTFSFIQRCRSSSNNLINFLMASGCFYESNFYVNYNNLLFALHNFQLPFGHACWPLFMLIFLCVCVWLLFTMDLALCCLCLPRVSEINK